MPVRGHCKCALNQIRQKPFTQDEMCFEIVSIVAMSFFPISSIWSSRITKERARMTELLFFVS